MNDFKKELEFISSQYTPFKTKLNKYVGFMGDFKNSYMTFKVKDITNKRAKGSRCDQMSFVGKAKGTKNDAIEVLEEIILKGDKYSTKIINNQKEICCKQELILRLYNNQSKLNKKWFIPPGIAIFINFENK